MKARYGLLVLLLLLTALFAFGCGEADDPDPNGDVNGDPNGDVGDENGEAPDDTAELPDRWDAPSTFYGMISKFDELKYSFNDGRSEEVYHFRYIESDSVNDVETDKVLISLSGQELYIWVDNNDRVLQAEMEGEILPDEMAESQGAALIATFLLPFNMAEGYNVHDYVDVPGFSIKLVDESPGGIGDLTGTVYTIEMIMGPPAVQKETKTTTRILDAGTFQIMIGLYVTEEDGEKLEFSIEVEELSLR